MRRGGKAQGRGISHSKQSGERAQRRSAQAKRGRLGRPLRRARAKPSASVVSLFVRMSARIFRVALRQEQAAVVGGERRASGGRQGGVELLPQEWALLSERTCHHSNRHETVLELANSNDAHAISSITSSIIGCFGTDLRGDASTSKLACRDVQSLG